MVEGENIILFDGTCILCNRAVQFILKRDKHKVFRFAGLESETAKSLLKTYPAIPDNTDSIIFLRDRHAYYKSTAVLKISKHLGRGFRILVLPGYLFPRFLRDRIYDIIANRRYKWFGRRDCCIVPEGNMKDRFI